MSEDSKVSGSSESADFEVEQLIKAVKTQGLVDDIVDGVYLGLLAICIIFIFMFAVFTPDLYELFPFFSYLASLFSKIPNVVLNFGTFYPEIISYLKSLLLSFPKNLDEFKALSVLYNSHISEFLSAIDYKTVILVFSWGAYVWHAYLDIRQRDMLHQIYRPPQIKSLVSRKAFLEANTYGLDKSSLKMMQSLFEQIKLTLAFYYDVLPLIWHYTGSFMHSKLGLGPEYEITHAILFFVFTTLINTISSIPFDLYGTFVVEAKHGFNNQTVSLFVTDLLKTILLVSTLGPLVLSGLLWTINKTGDNFYYYVMLFMMLVQFIGITIFPTLIQPLFNKFQPLEQGDLKSAIEALASRVDYPLKKLYVIDGSKRSSHSNAYMYGFFKNKRIVIFDTLLKQTNSQEVCAILAHELGHWKYNHVLKMLVAGQLQIFLIFYLFSLVIKQQKMYSDFNFTTMPVFIGFTLFQYLYIPLDSILTFFFNKLSRKNEFEADAFSKKLGYKEDLKQGLIKIHVENKGNLNPDKLYSAYHYSHPSLVERLRALDDPLVAPKSD
ncbi:hypothetical protein BB560_006098 [Smittium megazygosporum]|uniref:Ste24 endopeptidase n=1 Tax=Smittium megazygosporum TaxID=133381 RepID=A0A2T9YHU7_9FUNG|nr:hypothetical protein BB560_006098 [Smittium megazygosporum]